MRKLDMLVFGLVVLCLMGTALANAAPPLPPEENPSAPTPKYRSSCTLEGFLVDYCGCFDWFFDWLESDLDNFSDQPGCLES